MNLKEELYKIKENEYRAINGDVSLLNTLLENIGHVDSSLRDDLIYPILATWIMKHDLDDTQKKYVLQVCLNNLNEDLGEAGTDSVFKRTFSMLQIPVIIYTHNETPFLSQENVYETIDFVINYLALEQDLRGYISGKGWAHAVAHTADAYKEIAKMKNLDYGLTRKLFKSIKDKMTFERYVYINDEDERMILAVMNLINWVEEDYVIKWVQSFSEITPKGILPDDNIVQLNTKQFLRSFYFRVENQKIKESILNVLDMIDRYK